MKYKWLWFDIDNTLLDFTGASLKSFAALMEELGLPNTTEIHQAYKKSNVFCWEEFEAGRLSTVELRTKRFADFFTAIAYKGMDPLAANTQYLNRVIDFSETYPGVSEMLTQLKDKYKLSIITNGLKEVQRPRIAKTELTHFFESIIVSDEIGVAKPQAAFFDHTFQSINHQYNKSEILVIGDSPNSDILGGNNFGVDTCWVNWKGEKSTEVPRTYEINEILDLAKLV